MEQVEGYWLHRGDPRGWERVTRAEYITAERAAGFRRGDTELDIATRSFHNPAMGLRGSVVEPHKLEATLAMARVADDHKWAARGVTLQFGPGWAEGGSPRQLQVVPSPLLRPVAVTPDDQIRAMQAQIGELVRERDAARERAARLAFELRQARKERDERDREVVSRLAPKLGRLLSEAIRREITK